MNVIQKKICLLGDFAVGKTSLVRQYIEGRFSDKYLSTIGVKISRKTLHQPEHIINLLIWDLAGGDDFRDVESGYLRGAAGALLVCDLTRPSTMAAIHTYREQLLGFDPQAAFVILANKVDLTDQREISEAQLATLETETGIACLLTSAKTGVGVESAFDQLATLILDTA